MATGTIYHCLTLTYDLDLHFKVNKVKVDLHTKNQSLWPYCSRMRAQTTKRIDEWTKCIISLLHSPYYYYKTSKYFISLIRLIIEICGEYM